MQSTHILKEIKIIKTPRVTQTEGLFDVPPGERSALEWNVELPIDEKEWNIGLIVGPSGCGKTTIAKDLFRDKIIDKFDWPKEKTVLDGFPKSMGIKEIVNLLSSVGFSSPPSWLRPFRVLSTGEQFRVQIARILAENTKLAVVDEYTSVVDRNVAQIGSAAIAKTIRRRKQKFIAVTCHYDIIEWLQPDWIYEPTGNSFQWRCLRRFPEINLAIRKVHYRSWEVFKAHHYLDHAIHRAARCFVAYWKDNPVAFVSCLPQPPNKNCRRGHRLVVLPDYQGVGIGVRMAEFLGELCRALNWRFTFRAGSLGLIHTSNKSPNWKPMSLSSHGSKRHRVGGFDKTSSRNRLSCSFEYVGPSYPDKREARELLT